MYDSDDAMDDLKEKIKKIKEKNKKIETYRELMKEYETEKAKYDDLTKSGIRKLFDGLFSPKEKF